MKINKKTVILLAGVVILNAVLVGFYVIAFNAVKQQTEKAAAQTVALQEYREEGENTALVKKIIKETKEGGTQLETHFVFASNIVDFIELTESVGDKAGVELVLSDLRSSAKNMLTFSVSTKGSFQNTMQFMALMENMPFLINTQRASLSKGGSVATDFGFVNIWQGSFTFELRGYIGE